MFTCLDRIEIPSTRQESSSLKGLTMIWLPPPTLSTGSPGDSWAKRNLASLLPLVLWSTFLASHPQELRARQLPKAPVLATQDQSRPPETSQQLQQLVAPIALYPDSLVAQILAASTYPEQVVQADRWLQAHPELKGDALGKAVDREAWDPSVKALTGFPAVLGNMDKNLSWTSSLGDSFYNQPQDVMDAVQVMRKRAQGAGNLKTSPQQTIAAQGSTITIEPASPEIVYIPEYDPWSIYGIPMAAWPGWYQYPGIWFGGPYLTFGVGFGIGFYGGFEWGWPRWGFDWHNRYAMYNHNRYSSRSTTFYNRNAFYRGAAGRAAGGSRFGARPGSSPANRAFGGTSAGRGTVGASPRESGRTFSGTARIPSGRAEPAGRGGAGAFSGYQHGGQARGFSARGSGSLGGGAARGGAPRGGGGPSRGGGHHR
jgi:hypothetical protein